MKRILSALFVFALIFPFFFTACKLEDKTPPNVYLLGNDGVIVGTESYDTIILLYTDYQEPTRTVGDFTFVGVQYEDNASAVEDMVMENDIDRIRRTGGYVNLATDQTITYLVRDEANNETAVYRNLSIRNISEPFTGRYETNSIRQRRPDSLKYISNVRVDNRVPGRLIFPRVYLHTCDTTSELIFYRVNADLRSPDGSRTWHDDISYMGMSCADNGTPFFKDMSYEEGIDAIMDYTYLSIYAQNYQDTLGNYTYIAGRWDAENNRPRSRIEYLPGTTTIQRIVLELNITYKVGEDQVVDNVTEEYIAY